MPSLQNFEVSFPYVMLSSEYSGSIMTTNERALKTTSTDYHLSNLMSLEEGTGVYHQCRDIFGILLQAP